jgi:SAM-dependent methyltransferase
VSGNSWQRACPACGADGAAPVYENRMAPLDGRDLSYRVATCRACGLAFADRLAAPEIYAAYYRDLSKYDSFTDAAAIPGAMHVRSQAALRMVAPHVGRGERIADLGCGPGVLLAEFARAGWTRLAGLDPAPQAPGQARRLFGLDGIRSGALRDAHQLLGLEDAGLVCLTGVLEHLPLLREDLGRLLAALPPQAKLLVEVPALERFLDAPFEPYGEFSLEHLQYFSAASLTRLFAGFGYRPLALELLALPEGTTDSVLGLFGRGDAGGGTSAPDLGEYLRRSAAGFAEALAGADACAAPRVVLYGAGSHSARLLPALLERGWATRLVRLVDANLNLQGKRMGGLRIEAPEALLEEPGATVLISSCRSQDAIAASLARRFPNPLLRLYGSAAGVRLG